MSVLLKTSGDNVPSPSVVSDDTMVEMLLPFKWRFFNDAKEARLATSVREVNSLNSRYMDVSVFVSGHDAGLGGSLNSWLVLA